jgi:TetR/AcrR family transcriptional regulator, regulator of biofilm formation and stress response
VTLADSPYVLAPGADRKEQIIAAAALVIAEQGVSAFTFRAVAAAANVPLGSTTYYFKDKEDLLDSTIRAVSDQSRSVNKARLSRHVERHGPTAGLAHFIEELTVHEHEELLMNYRLYATALYHPSLQPEVAAWHPEMDLLPYFDSGSAKTLGFLVEGLLMHSVVNKREFYAEEVLPLLASVVPTA